MIWQTKGHSLVVKQKKRCWFAGEKISVYQQTTTPGVLVAQIACQYALNANLTFKWLRAERYSCSLDGVPKPESPVFLILKRAALLGCRHGWIMVPEPNVAI